MDRKRVLLTGVGITSPIGNRMEDFWEALTSGRSGVGPITRFDPERFACRQAAQVEDPDLDLDGCELSHEVRRLGLFVRYALAAAGRALEQSGLAGNGHRPRGGAVFLGVATGGLPNMEAGVIRQETRGPRKVTPYLIPSLIPNMAASTIALVHGFNGPQYTIAGACSSGTQAMGQAFQAIRSGQLEWALAGGTDAVLTPLTFSSFQAMRILSTRDDATPRPFDSDGDGLIVGEGAALFVLEAEDHAATRGALPVAELRGYGTCSGGAGIINPSAPRMIHSMELALQDAGLDASEVDCVHAQATGMALGDLCELEALSGLFHARGLRPAITSIKGHIGHTFAASAPLNVAAAVASLEAQRVPGTLNFSSPPRRFADVEIARQPIDRPIRHAITSSVGFGGLNATLVISRCNGHPESALRRRRDHRHDDHLPPGRQARTEP